MEEIEGYTKGHIYTERIDHADADKFSRVFGEGSPALTELIKFCILNNIKTIASCKGHPEKRNPLEAIIENGYITFVFDSNRDLAYFIASLPFKIKGIYSRVDNNYKVGNAVTLYVPARIKNQSEAYFSSILLNLKKFIITKNNGINYEPQQFIKKIVDYEFQVPNTALFDITRKKVKKHDYYGKSTYFSIIGKCPNFENSILYRLFTSEEKARKKEDLFIESKKGLK